MGTEGLVASSLLPTLVDGAAGVLVTWVLGSVGGWAEAGLTSFLHLSLPPSHFSFFPPRFLPCLSLCLRPLCSQAQQGWRFYVLAKVRHACLCWFQLPSLHFRGGGGVGDSDQVGPEV